LIIMPETTVDNVFLAVDRLRNTIAAEEMQVLYGVRVRITLNIGGAAFPEDGLSSEDLLVKADERPYRAKREGKKGLSSISTDFRLAQGIYKETRNED